MIQFENISKSFPSGSLFKNVNLTIKRGIRVGLVGKNGSGKTTLLKMMLGKESPDSGNIKKEKDLTIGYLQQEIVIGTERSIIEEVMASYPGAYDLEKKIISLTEKISNSPTNIDLANQLGEAQHEFDSIGGWSLEKNAKKNFRRLRVFRVPVFRAYGKILWGLENESGFSIHSVAKARCSFS